MEEPGGEGPHSRDDERIKRDLEPESVVHDVDGNAVRADGENLGAREDDVAASLGEERADGSGNLCLPA